MVMGMKKTFGILLAAAMLLTGSSCSVLSKLSKGIKNERDSVRSFEKTALKALEDCDEELLKSCFSKRALERADDFDKGMKYAIDLYRDGKATVVDENSSSYSFYEGNGHYKYVRGYCKFNSGNNRYKMVWTQWLEDTRDPDMVGVYSFDLIELSDNDDVKFWDIAGINYPERQYLHDMFSTISETDGASYDTEARDIFSEELLDNAALTEISPMLKVVFAQDGNSVGVLWTDTDSGHTDVYAEIRYDTKDYIMAFRTDGEKVTAASAAEKAEDIVIKDNDITGFAAIVNS